VIYRLPKTCGSNNAFKLKCCALREMFTMIGVYLVVWAYVRETSDNLVPVEADFQHNLEQRMDLICNVPRAEGDSPYV
jgi:hypothetical protein